MNSLWNKNLQAFKNRFPQLAENFSQQISDFQKTPSQNFQIVQAKNGQPVALHQNLPLHSKYNPEREAQQLCTQFDSEKFSATVFYSCGLGWGPLAFCRQHPDIPLVIIEKDINYILEAFTALDWEEIFSHPQLILLTGASSEEAASVIDRLKADKCCIFENPAQSLHAKEYFSEIKQCLVKLKNKNEINTNTLERFSHLWLKNSCKNLHFLSELDGVKKYSGTTEIPFVILAAGPSLQNLLPYLDEIKKRSILVCVDTALHACLKQKVEPDFILLMDPQYACFLHLEFLSSPSSILITESAVYPEVFDFCCKEKVLCSSLFPIGKYFEEHTEIKGALNAGGSVTTTAWDFARLCGTKKIFIAGMDLGFPGRQTHIRGSQFEERAHRVSDRFNSSETENLKSLFSADISTAKDYSGNTLLTDKRMKLFSWWFEEHCTQAALQGLQTFSLTEESLMIKGINYFSPQEFLSFPEVQNEKKIFFQNAENKSSDKKQLKINYEAARNNFVNKMISLQDAAKKGITICQKAIEDRTRIPKANAQLKEIDSFILNSDAKSAAALVFPTERQLAAKAVNLPETKELYPLYYSRLIYQELLAAVKEYLYYFE